MSVEPNQPPRKHLRHYEDADHAHELTFSCYHAHPYLSRERPCAWLAQAVEKTRADLGCSVLAYVFMPEHVHLLLLPRRPDFRVEWFLKRVKQSVARTAKEWLQRNAAGQLDRFLVPTTKGQQVFRFWQSGGGYDRNVTDVKTLRSMIDYIHNNPVRRGLAREAAEWKWSSARWYERREPGPITIDVEW